MNLADNQLTELQQKFIENYLTNGFNLSRAAKDAGYADSTAETRAWELLANPRIKPIIEQAYQKRNEQISNLWTFKVNTLLEIINDYYEHRTPGYQKGAIQAIRELNLMQGDHAPDKRFNVNVELTKDRLAEASKVYEEY